jgi:acetoacetyl-CoA synthetase
LFAAIAESLGRELPSSTIYRAPTITSLASLLEQPEVPQFSPFVVMKPGTQSPPVFVIHGLAGNVQFFKLAQHLRTDQPIYGVEARGIDGLEEPFDSVEDMASQYLCALEGNQFRGPVTLIGYSFGGLIALEMAHRMALAGKPTPTLILVDAYPAPAFMPRVERLRLTAKRTKRHALEIKRLPLSQSVSYVARGVRKRLGLEKSQIPESSFPSEYRVSLARTTCRVKEKAYVALANYRPPHYRGKIMFVKAGEDSYFPSDPRAAWGDLLGDFEVERIPGSHVDVVTRSFEGLAEALTNCLQRA